MEIREIRTGLMVRHVEITDKEDKVGNKEIRGKNRLSHDITPLLNNGFQTFAFKNLLYCRQRVVQR